MNPASDSPNYLMCPPDYFGVDYVINPWMEGNQGRIDRERARAQWDALYGLLTGTLKAQVSLLAPQAGLPDLVFTANAGLVAGVRCMPSRFRPLPRQPEEPHFRQWFTQAGFALHDLPDEFFFEGAGDALFGEVEDSTALWCAYGFRTDFETHSFLRAVFAEETFSLYLTDARFYHLDTCFCPLPGGYLLWYPAAFDHHSVALIEHTVPKEKRYAVSQEDALDFACNAVGVRENGVVLNSATDTLKRWLEKQGFAVFETPLTEFMKAGGSAKCLTLRIS